MQGCGPARPIALSLCFWSELTTFIPVSYPAYLSCPRARDFVNVPQAQRQDLDYLKAAHGALVAHTEAAQLETWRCALRSAGIVTPPPATPTGTAIAPPTGEMKWVLTAGNVREQISSFMNDMSAEALSGRAIDYQHAGLHESFTECRVRI